MEKEVIKGTQHKSEWLDRIELFKDMLEESTLGRVIERTECRIYLTDTFTNN